MALTAPAAFATRTRTAAAAGSTLASHAAQELSAAPRGLLGQPPASAPPEAGSSTPTRQVSEAPRRGVRSTS